MFFYLNIALFDHVLTCVIFIINLIWLPQVCISENDERKRLLHRVIRVIGISIKKEKQNHRVNRIRSKKYTLDIYFQKIAVQFPRESCNFEIFGSRLSRYCNALTSFSFFANTRTVLIVDFELNDLPSNVAHRFLRRPRHRGFPSQVTTASLD